jgi:membrane dipeptidase
MQPLVDGHLDLAENVTLFGRDLTLPVADLRRAPGCEQATVTLPELERGGVAVAIATVSPGFKVEDVPPGRVPESALYRTPEEAEAHALRQLDLYERWHGEGRLRLLRSASDLEHHLDLWRADHKPGIVLLMEGADPIVEVRDLPRWWARGLRLVGLTYGDTRYGTGVAGGSRPPRAGGLTDAGRELLREMAALGMGWDISHLAEQGVQDGLELGIPNVCASHANARALLPTDRHLSDDAIRSLGRRAGVIGLVLYNGYLQPGWTRAGAEVRVGDQVRAHAEHIASIAGWQAVGIGSDLDGGFGRDASPADIDTIADLHLIGSIPPAEHREALLGGNWLRFLRRVV